MVNKKCCLSFNTILVGPHPELRRKPEREERSRLRRLKPKKNNRSLEKRPYPILSGFVLSRKRWSRIIPKEWKLLAASSESMQRVTTVVSGRSVKCNEIFAVWFFAVVDLFSRPCGCFTFPISGNTMLRYEQQTLTTAFLYAKIWLPRRKKFWILRLF